MPTPEFVLDLRAKIGHSLLWLPTATGVVIDDAGRILLGRRADNGAWALPGGIVEPGEEPADAAVREIFEETAVIAEPEALIAVTSFDEITYANGDVVRYLDVLFRCRAAGGTARVNDSESTEVAWRALDDLPAVSERTRYRIDAALAGGPHAVFRFSGVAAVLGPVR